jgi:MFS family permease
MVGQGLAYSAFAAVLWPSIPLVVEPRYTGLGYGIVTSVQNGGLALFPIIIAKIANDHGGEYIPYAELFFISCGALGFVIGLYLNYYDYYHNSIFNKPTSKQTKYEALDSDEDRDNTGEITVAYDNIDSKTISKIVSSNDTTINALHDK